MCGQFFIDYDDEEVRRIVDEVFRNRLTEEAPLTFSGGRIYPGMQVPIITNQGSTFALWGFPALNPHAKAHINVRNETADRLPTFQNSFKKQRCLIPASAYYEWQKTATKRIGYQFSLANRQLFYLAGIYTANHAFAILTKTATEQFQDIHERMPVVISPDHHQDWLTKETAIDFPTITAFNFELL